MWNETWKRSEKDQGCNWEKSERILSWFKILLMVMNGFGF